MISWIDFEVENYLLESWIEDSLGVKIHPAALDHLTNATTSNRLPFPRFEKHIDYLFGIIYIPSNTENPSADFDELNFVATHDHVIASVFRHPTSNLDWEKLKFQLGDIDTEDSTPDGGQFILNLFKETVGFLWDDANNIQTALEKEIETEIGSKKQKEQPIKQLTHRGRELPRKERRDLLEKFNQLAPTLSIISGEMNQMMRIAVETESILQRLSTDDKKFDLQKDQSGAERELFSTELEIYLADTWELCRVLVATLEEIEASMEHVNQLVRALSDEENVAAGRFTGAIASIMLLPTFIVGLYGQNFVSMPETNWQHGYLFSWGAIIILTLSQIFFFRRRKWL